jgi:ACS family glucarate transporter-like MFS transporter
MTSTGAPAATAPGTTRVRYVILVMLFVVTTVNYADRAALSIAGPAAARELGLDPLALGYVLSAFGWAYVLGQLPGGWLLDRFGSMRVYAASIVSWSILTALQGLAGALGAGRAVPALFALVFLMGLAESPSFPGNGRIAAAWFPARERGTASAIFNSAQYFATVVFAPLSGWLTQAFGWRYVFAVLGSLGVLLAALWLKTMRNPADHPRVSQAELAYIEQGGGLVHLDRRRPASLLPAGQPPSDRVPRPGTWATLRQLLAHRTLVGVYVGQYCITTLTYFFLTWLPVYLVVGRGMTALKAGLGASLPALVGFGGGLLGGVFSDFLLKRGRSLTFARKLPIVAGMLLATSMIACNYVTDVRLVIAIMCVAFFGKGIGSLGWAVVSDTSPRQAAGLCGGVFNMFGNTAAITTPMVIGYLVQGSRSFDLALVFVGANALGAILSYLVVVGEIRRVELA